MYSTAFRITYTNATNTGTLFNCVTCTRVFSSMHIHVPYKGSLLCKCICIVEKVMSLKTATKKHHDSGGQFVPCLLLLLQPRMPFLLDLQLEKNRYNHVP